MQSLKDAGLTDGDSAFLVGFDSEEQHMEMGTMFDYVVNDKHKLTAGLEYRKPDHTKQKNRNNYETIDFINALVLGLGNRIRYYSEVIASSDSAETRNREVLGLYIQDEWAVSEQLNLTLGARYDDYSDFGSTLNPRASVNYKASKNWSYKLMYGSAYRAPSNIEQTVKNSPVEIGNVNLQPEEVKTWEASALYQEQDMVFQVTLFDNSLSNQIMQIPLEDDPRITYVNLGKANARGLEIEFNYQLFDSWRLSSNYTHYFSRASEGNITANNLASVILAFQQNKFTASLSTTYRSGVEQPLADGEIERLASVTLLNANMRYEISDQLLMSLKIHNLLDRDNRSLSLNTPLAGGVPNKKRSA